MADGRWNTQKIDKDSPIAFLLALSKGMPEITNYCLKRISYRIISRAKDYLRHKRDPYGVEWEEVWREYRTEYTTYDKRIGGERTKKTTPYVPGGNNLGKWTPEFNTRERKSEVNRTVDEPMYDTGALADSLRILSMTRAKTGSKAYAVIGSRLPYSAILEDGGINILGKEIPARPYLTPAFLEVMNDKRFLAIVKKEIVTVIKKSRGGGEIKFPDVKKPD